MKSNELRRGIRFVSYAALAMASAACEPTILFGTPPGQGGQAGQGGGVDDGGVAGAGGVGGEAGAGGAGGAGGSGGSGGGTSSSTGSSSSSTGSSSSSTGSSSSSTGSSSSSTGSSSSSTGSSSSSTGSSSSSTGSSSSSTGSSSSSTGSSSSSTGSSSSSTGSSSSSTGSSSSSTGSSSSSTGSSSSSSGGGAGGAGGAGGSGGSGGSGECADGQTQPCYSGPMGTENVGACKGGVETCVNGQWSTCTGEVIPSSETCDGLDNDCDGVINNDNPGGGGFCWVGIPGACNEGIVVCNGGGLICESVLFTQCSTGLPGNCDAGIYNCVNGQALCLSYASSYPEKCDGIDNNCNGTIDEGNPEGGQSCTTGGTGACGMGTKVCTGGAIVCQTPQPTAEICDGIDNNCDGTVDEGNPGSGAACNTGMPGACAPGITQCTDGMLECNATGGDPELCDGIDNDCDGVVDNGNPGGGAPCGTTLGGCGEYTLCVNGSYVCRGTFIAPPSIGAPGNPGTQAQPVSTIAEGQELAKALNNGADICICATTPGTPTIYAEYVTMSEGNSLFGGYNCANWSRDIANYETRIEPDEFDPYPTPSLPNPCYSVAVYFPPSAAPATALDGLSVYGRKQFGRYDNDSMAIQVVNASAVLQDVIAKGGRADYSRALQADTDSANSHHITVTRGRYEAHGGNGTAFSGQRAVSLGMTGTFTDVVMAGLGGGAETALGFGCWDCGATTITGGSIHGGSGDAATGMYVTGDVNGFTMTNTSITATMPGYNPSSMGAWFNDCIGAPSLTNVTIDAGYFHWQGSGVTSKGAQCAPTIIGAEINGNGGLVSSGTAVECTDNSACNVIDSVITSGNIGVSCSNGGCGTFSGNTITTTAGNSPLNNNIRIDNAHPNFHDNEIVAGACLAGAGPYQLEMATFTNSSAVLTNNVFRDRPCPNTTVDMVKLDAGAAVTIHNNTFQLETCTGCGVRRGLVFASATGANVRNNIFVNAGTIDFWNAFGVYETAATSSLLSFENNALWMPNGGTLYVNDASTILSLAGINALSGAAGNIEADPLLDATYHLLPASPCRNAGKTVAVPLVDFDGDARPQEMSFDIGADEYVP